MKERKRITFEKRVKKYNLQNVNNFVTYVSQTYFKNHGIFFHYFVNTRIL